MTGGGSQSVGARMMRCRPAGIGPDGQGDRQQPHVAAVFTDHPTALVASWATEPVKATMTSALGTELTHPVGAVDGVALKFFSIVLEEAMADHNRAGVGNAGISRPADDTVTRSKLYPGRCEANAAKHPVMLRTKPVQGLATRRVTPTLWLMGLDQLHCPARQRTLGFHEPPSLHWRYGLRTDAWRPCRSCP